MRIMVVDDELPIREWIRMMIQRVDQTLEVVACVASGEEAYKAFTIYRPELVISDIKMGTMDGIELLRKIKEIEPETHFVLLTSHNDFNYARDGIRYGANEYILKTEVTVESIAKIIENFKLEQEKDSNIKMKEYIEDVFGYEENELYCNEIALEKSYFVIAYRSDFEGVGSSYSLSEKVKIIGNYFDRESRQYFILEGCEGISQVNQYNEAFNVAKTVATLHSIKVGFSGAAYEINSALQKAKKALELTFYQENNHVSSYMNTHDEETRKQLIEYRGSSIREIYNDNIDRVMEQVDIMLKYAKAEKYGEIKELKNYVVDILHAYKLSMLNLGHSQLCLVIDRTKENVLGSESFEEMYREISIAFSRDEGEYIDGEQYSLYTKKAIIFIKENYKDNISLIDVVEKLNINSEYFCRIFKKETGKTFLTYLTDYKIKKAQELLAKSDYSIQEISDKLGYSSVAYFSRVFKSKTGYNPYKFKKQ